MVYKALSFDTFYLFVYIYILWVITRNISYIHLRTMGYTSARFLFLPRAERAERELQGILDAAALEHLETKCPGVARSGNEVRLPSI